MIALFSDMGMPWWIPIGAIFVAALSGGFGFLVYFPRREPDEDHAPNSEDHTRDSPEFFRALGWWQPVVLRVSGNSPRQWKRFVNHVRFLACLLHPTLEAPLIVALAALQRLNGDKNPLPKSISAVFSGHSQDFCDWADAKISNLASERQPQDSTFGDEIRTALKTAIKEHRNHVTEGVAEKDIERFSEMARNIVTR